MQARYQSHGWSRTRSGCMRYLDADAPAGEPPVDGGSVISIAQIAAGRMYMEARKLPSIPEILSVPEFFDIAGLTSCEQFVIFRLSGGGVQGFGDLLGGAQGCQPESAAVGAP